MSVGSQVTKAVGGLAGPNYEDAIIAASVAFSATARLVHPKAKDSVACRQFVADNLPLISKVAWGRFGVSGPINFRYRRLDAWGQDRPLEVRSTAEMLYDVVRCTAVHEARIPSNLRFVDAPLIQLGLDGELILPIDLIYGLILAVVASPCNARERISGVAKFSYAGKKVDLNDLWGEPSRMAAVVGLTP